MKNLIFALLTLLLTCASADAAGRFAVCATSCTWDGSSTAMWSATTGGATGASVPVSTDDVVIDGNSCVGGTTCTITVNTNFNINSLNINGCNASTTGCILDFSVNNNNVTIQGAYVDGGGTNNVNVKFGSAVISIVATPGGNTAWSHSGAGITFTPGTSTININGTLTGARTFSPGNGSYATVSIGANTSGGFVQFSSGTATFATLTLIGPTNITWGTGNTISTAFNLNGTSANQVFMQSPPSSAQVTVLGNPTVTATWAGFRDIAFSNPVIASNSMDFGDNANITFVAGGGSGGGCILGGWLLWRDMPDHINDNFPAWIEKAA